MAARTRHSSLINFSSPSAIPNIPEVPVASGNRDYVIEPESNESLYASSEYSLESALDSVHPGSRVDITGNPIPSPRHTLWSGNSPITRPSAAALARRQSSPAVTSPKSNRFTNPFSKVLLKSPSLKVAEAASKGQTRLVQLLIQEGHDVNAKDFTGKTALHRAASAGYLDIVKILLWEGAEVDARAGYGQSSLGNHMYGTTLYGNTISDVTPLHRAAKNGHAEICRLLIETGADVNALTNYHQTPLHFAAESGMEDAVAVLVRDGQADLELVTNKGRSAVRLAAQANHESVMRVIVEERVLRRQRGSVPVKGKEKTSDPSKQVLEVPEDHRRMPNSPEFLRQWIVENQGGKLVEIKVPGSSGSETSSDYWNEWQVVNA